MGCAQGKVHPESRMESHMPKWIILMQWGKVGSAWESQHGSFFPSMDHSPIFILASSLPIRPMTSSISLLTS